MYSSIFHRNLYINYNLKSIFLFQKAPMGPVVGPSCPSCLSFPSWPFVAPREPCNDDPLPARTEPPLPWSWQGQRNPCALIWNPYETHVKPMRNPYRQSQWGRKIMVKPSRTVWLNFLQLPSFRGLFFWEIFLPRNHALILLATLLLNKHGIAHFVLLGLAGIAECQGLGLRSFQESHQMGDLLSYPMPF